MIDVLPLLRARTALTASEHAERHRDVPEALKQAAIAAQQLRQWQQSLSLVAEASI